MCGISLCIRGALDALSRGRSTATLGAMTEALLRLVDLAGSASLTCAKLRESAAEMNMALEELLDRVSLAIAKRYDEGALKFEAADDAMNRLWGCLVARPSHEIVIPDITREIFEAFDEGEYHHSDDAHDVDPEAKYTRPLVRSALFKYR